MPQVLIVGAGPTGLVLGLWLTRLGVRVRIIDKAAQPALTSRAVGVQARTLEFYAQVGLADTVAARGRRAIAASMWVKRCRVARAVFGDIGAGLSPYPYALIFPQDEHEQLLVERLGEAGVAIERQVELLDFEEAGGRVIARLRHPDGAVETCEAAYIAGCDGAHSAVRDALSIGFPGGTYAHLFYVADVEASGPAMNGEVHVAFDTTDFLAVFPLKRDGHARFVGTARREGAREHDDLSWDDVGKRVIGWMQLEVARVNWLSTYRVHHRVAGRFRAGRAFLLGDAAHIHSPVGGQGMNTGIGDAVNLAWKLASVVRGRAEPALLDTYEPERIAFARRLVATTDRAFTAVTSSSVLARTVRLRLVPLVVPSLFRFRAMRRFVFRTVSQTAVNYRGSALSEGRAGRVQGGDRLPWVKLAGGAEAGNFAPLTSLDWQVHVYGEPAPSIQSACAERRVPLHVFAWEPGRAASGLQRNALYLVRPDGYVGLAADDDGAAALRSYLDARRLTAS
jgi:2-polyprenyl-6-methoxyphenol hydroxylase-like FAD-dependent oxidoreductase